MFRTRKLLCLSPIRTSLSRFKSYVDQVNCVNISEEVRFALHERLPVVALESTIITHGLPFPDNVEYGQDVEAIIRQQVHNLTMLDIHKNATLYLRGFCLFAFLTHPLFYLCSIVG